MELARLASSKQQATPQFSATFLGTTFVSVGPPPVGNGALVVFWQNPGPGRLEKFRAQAKNKKTEFPGARGPKTDGCPQLSYSSRFDRPDPHGRENAKNEDFGPFWPRTAVGTRRNPGTGPNTENRNFPVLGGPK